MEILFPEREGESKIHTWTGQYNKELSAVYGTFTCIILFNWCKGKFCLPSLTCASFHVNVGWGSFSFLTKLFLWISSPTNSASSILMREIDLDYCHLAVQLLIWLARAWTQIYAQRFSVLVLWRFAPLSTVCMLCFQKIWREAFL